MKKITIWLDASRTLRAEIAGKELSWHSHQIDQGVFESLAELIAEELGVTQVDNFEVIHKEGEKERFNSEMLPALENMIRQRMSHQSKHKKK